ncbi:trichoplein keratin filament-binding protein [Rhagoletis pomonella]|uniref:trichoplein keratin filament-binding protein n=1 Tax=Rhagoletis pomonella TaxID=28610 RepID=UPI0017877346|nr:trichoplein keratin filament-binding protein [Rhagoletis pomonella]XP_036322477.1 trichoplein keratin filament-binding protein [Rhagoletis pomonella]
MSVHSHQMQALFARRREIEHDRVERTAAVNRYYDHWGKVTSRFENWTNPEYYKNAEEQLKQRREKREKEQQQHKRRERLRELFEKEKAMYERELLARDRPRPRKISATNEQLEKIGHNQRERENIKRKLDLEAKLYGRWRHGVDDDNVLFESKSSNETLAKLNWLDKKIEEQMDRERQEAQSQERNLRLQKEINRTEEVQRERQLIREKEIKEIRALQEKHMGELKQRQVEADDLKEEEKHLRTCLADLEKELELLEESCTLVMETTGDVSQAFNLRKIKVFIRKRSEAFCNQIKLCISILERLIAFTTRADTVKQLLSKYKEHLEAESYTFSQVEAMYESEAKYNVQRFESAWQQQHLERYHEVKQLLTEECCTFGGRISENLQRQTEAYEVRSTHLSALENSNEKLKQLIAEEEQSPRSAPTLAGCDSTMRLSGGFDNRADAADRTSVADDNVSIAQLMPSSARIASAPTSATHYGRRRPTSTELPKVTNSFTNLNLDVWQDLPSAHHGIDSPRLTAQRSISVVTPESASRPKFARKRVAWT